MLFAEPGSNGRPPPRQQQQQQQWDSRRFAPVDEGPFRMSAGKVLKPVQLPAPIYWSHHCSRTSPPIHHRGHRDDDCCRFQARMNRHQPQGCFLVSRLGALHGAFSWLKSAAKRSMSSAAALQLPDFATGYLAQKRRKKRKMRMIMMERKEEKMGAEMSESGSHWQRCIPAPAAEHTAAHDPTVTAGCSRHDHATAINSRLWSARGAQETETPSVSRSERPLENAGTAANR